MCGIMGVIGRRRDFDWTSWGRLTAHRGPDAFGLWTDDVALLGHNRLSILDLSSAANQPMISADGRYVVVFNGEIFNFRELRDELQRFGYVFRTSGDTEVLLHSYIHWGAASLRKFDGMFAFAVWDSKLRVLFMARDHAGIKPLFYTSEGGEFQFGSEMKLLLALPASRRRLRLASLYEYLVYSYIPAPYTPYVGLMKLEPGHCMKYGADQRSVEITRWWGTQDLAHAENCAYELGCKMTRAAVGESVRRRLVADVPVGAFLSGGVDSSIIAAEMAAAGQDVKTFSIGYKNNDEYDETIHAKQVAEALKIEHEVVYPELTAPDIDRYADLVVRHFDEPYGNPTVILTYLLTSLVREKVTVALVGDGGDELFAGYPRHHALQLRAKLQPFLAPIAPAVLLALDIVRETPAGNHRVRRARRFFQSLRESAGTAFQDWSSMVLASDVRNYAPAVPWPNDARMRYIGDIFDSHDGDDLARACVADVNSFLPYNLLEGADRMSMANGFELRVPFVDRRLMEFAAGLPSKWKVREGRSKAILKDAYRDLLPHNVLSRPKRGFNPPMWHWLQQNEPYVRSRLGPKSHLSGFVRPEYIASALGEFFSHRRDCSTHIWALIVLEKWLESVSGFGYWD